jgi:RNA polymerase sigma factor (sigma-70 family)
VTDSELLRQAQAGDGTALRTLYERYVPSVWRYVYAQVGGDSHTAQDLVSETFLAAVRSIGTVAADTMVGGWLIGIARHKVGDQRRRSRLAERAQIVMKQSAEARPAEPTTPLEAEETRGQVAAALDRLLDEERQVLEWKYLQELSVRDIAERLGRTEKAIEALLYRARQSFRSHMK